jgi:hypothetical protein
MSVLFVFEAICGLHAPNGPAALIADREATLVDIVGLDGSPREGN